MSQYVVLYTLNSDYLHIRANRQTNYIIIHKVFICKEFTYNPSCTLFPMCYIYNCIIISIQTNICFFLNLLVFFPLKNCIIAHSVIRIESTRERYL